MSVYRPVTTAPTIIHPEPPPAPAFDYGVLDLEKAAQLRALVPEIRRAARASIENVAAVGRHLNAAKELLGHGHFQDWLRAEFALSERTAQNYMKVARVIEENRNIADLRPTLIYQLPKGETNTASWQSRSETVNAAATETLRGLDKLYEALPQRLFRSAENKYRDRVRNGGEALRVAARGRYGAEEANGALEEYRDYFADAFARDVSSGTDGDNG
jgi:hypothetical protein